MGVPGEIPQDAYSGRSALLRKILFHAGRSGISEFRYAVWANWCPNLLGPVVSRGRAGDGVGRRAGDFLSDEIGWHPAEKAEFGAGQLDAWRTIQRSHAIANGVYVAVVNRVGFEGPGGAQRATASAKSKRDPSTARPGASRKNKSAGRSTRDDGAQSKTESGDTGIEFWGNSFVADPFGRVVAKATNTKKKS